MKKFRNMLLAVALCVMATFFCVGCSITKHMTVEQYAAVVNAQLESEGLFEQYKSQGLDMKIEADGNVLV